MKLVNIYQKTNGQLVVGHGANWAVQLAHAIGGIAVWENQRLIAADYDGKLLGQIAVQTPQFPNAGSYAIRDYTDGVRDALITSAKRPWTALEYATDGAFVAQSTQADVLRARLISCVGAWE